MTTSNPEVLAWSWAYQRLQADHERLQADHERLQAECEELRKDAERRKTEPGLMHLCHFCAQKKPDER